MSYLEKLFLIILVLVIPDFVFGILKFLFRPFGPLDPFIGFLGKSDKCESQKIMKQQRRYYEKSYKINLSKDKSSK